MNLAEFLLRRLAEDEAAARAAIDPDRPGTHWHWVMDATDTPVRHGHLQGAQDDGESASLRTVEEYPTRSGVGPLPHFVIKSGEVHGGGGEHIANWDPARVLAECAFKRRIVELHRNQPLGDSWICEVCTDSEYGGLDKQPCETLRLLALSYADHPDYREEWRV